YRSLEQPTSDADYRLTAAAHDVQHYSRKTDSPSTAPRRTNSGNRNRRHGLLGTDNGTCVVREVDVKSGVHMVRRVTRGRVFHHRNLVPELGGKANGGLHARMCQ